MNRVNQVDVVIELSELCREIVAEALQQLHYYRASVYKQETARQISQKIEKLRLVANLLNCDLITEAFSDHDAEKALGPQASVLGECSFSIRSGRLLSSILQQTELILEQAHQRKLTHVAKDLSRNVYRFRRELLAICKQGSRQWAFFQSI